MEWHDLFYQNSLMNKRKILYTSIISLCAILLSFSLYHFYFAHRIIPGVVIGKVNVGGQKYDAAKNLLVQKEKTTKKELTLKYDDKVFVIKYTDVDLKYDWDGAVTRAFEIGRTGNLFVDTRDKLAGLVKSLYIKSFYTFDADLFSRALLSIKGEINILPKDAKFVLNQDKLDIVSSFEGMEVDGNKLFTSVITAFDNLDFSDKLVTAVSRSPSLVQSDLAQIQNEAEKVIKNPLKVVYGKRVWALTRDQLLNFMQVEKNGDRVSLDLNKSNFESYLESLGQDVNELPRGEVTGTDGTRVTGFKLVSDGKELDVKKFTSDFKVALFDMKPSVEVSVKKIVGAETDTTKYGILSLLGEGTSKYSGSIPARIRNLTLAASRTNGVLVPPRGIYSFNKSVGEISGATGYDSAYIINNGRTVLGEGGGVCQTSTTLFRAILNAGLPVVQRFPHAYRVRYYEIESPLGMDASVFQPSLDLQFRNDTPNYVLVTASWDLSQDSLSFKIYGTPDGRIVEISEPVVSNVTAPPATLYQDDPTLAKGIVRQVDFSAWGATVYFTRTVKKGDVILFKDTFTSKYQPWRAIFLVGTKV